MILSRECLDCFEKAETIFDFMSITMQFIFEQTQNERLFLSKYFSNNMELKKDLVGAITALFKQKGVSYLEIKYGIIECVNRLKCEGLDTSDPFVSLGVMYAILKGLDSGLPQSLGKTSLLGPLDSDDSNHKFRVYRRPSYALNSDYANWVGRQPFKDKDLHLNFDNFVFLDSYYWLSKKTGSVPTGFVVDSYFNTKNIDFVPRDKKVKIGVSPFCKHKNFSFEFESEDHGLFTVKYEENQDEYVSFINTILDKVSDSKCDFFVMPEYSTSPKIVQAIQDKLLQLQSEGKHTPILTFAGSQWTSDNNNVQYILDGSGKILDEYYKYCNFRDPKKDYEEALNNPGKRCVFFYVEGVGLIFPSICRDVIDPNYTRYLAGLFYPLLVINSAWSKSVDHICEPFHSIAYEYLSSSVFANSCSALMEKFEAREEEKAPIGHCHITSKEKTIPEPISKEYIREKNCNDCSLGCLFISEFFFGQYKETIDNDKSEFEDVFDIPTLDVYQIDVES